MQKFKTSGAELRKRPPRNPAPFWSLLFFIFFLWKQRRLQVKEIQNTTRHTAMHMTSTTSFSVRFRVPRRQNKPLTREGNHHQQSTMAGLLVSQSNQNTKSQTLSSRSLPREDNDQAQVYKSQWNTSTSPINTELWGRKKRGGGENRKKQKKKKQTKAESKKKKHRDDGEENREKYNTQNRGGGHCAVAIPFRSFISIAISRQGKLSSPFSLFLNLLCI